MWQLIETKQKFISQIMTSKSPVRSCEDVDEMSLSFAEVKALAAGNPAIKEKMSLDVEVAKLKLLRANHMNNIYRMEDDIAKKFPKKIAELTELIEGYKEDISHYKAHKIPAPELFQMEIGGKTFTEKKEAGLALLDACSQAKSMDTAVDIGHYQGFCVRIQFDSCNLAYLLSLKHTVVASVFLGSDPVGNITRINNLLESYPDKLAEAQQKLETVNGQLENAKQEVTKPFPKEQELNQMLERLSELNALLNMDQNKEENEVEREEGEKKSIHDKLLEIKENNPQERTSGKEEKGNDLNR